MAMKNRMLVLTLIWVLASCAPAGSPEPTQTLTMTATQVPSSTYTPTAAPTMTPTPKQLGGSEVAYVWDSHNHLLKSVPEGVTNVLANPSSPEVWQQPTGLFYSDGTPLPWGKYFVDTLGSTRVNFPVLVRGVVEVPNPSAQVGGTIILPVFEVPAQGGSNFILAEYPVACYVGSKL